jgi:hypothetical protein
MPRTREDGGTMQAGGRKPQTGTTVFDDPKGHLKETSLRLYA